MRDEGEWSPDRDADTAARLRRAALGTAAAGAAFAVLFVASMFALSRTPGPRASDAVIAAFYASDERRWIILTGLYLLPFATVAFLWFVAVLRDWESNSTRRLSRVLANVQILSGVGFLTLSLASAAASAVTAFANEFGGVQVEPTLARQFPLYGSALLYVFAMRMAAIFVTSTAGIIRATGIFPLWFVALSYLVAAFLFLAATLSVWLVLVFPVWVVILCALIVIRANTLPPPAGTTVGDDVLEV